MLMHESGEYFKSTIATKAQMQTPQAIGSATTYAKRYAICSMLGISGDDDDDGTLGTHGSNPEVAKRVVAPKPQPNDIRIQLAKAYASSDAKKSGQSLSDFMFLSIGTDKPSTNQDIQRVIDELGVKGAEEPTA
jgi:hypothetical protein